MRRTKTGLEVRFHRGRAPPFAAKLPKEVSKYHQTNLEADPNPAAAGDFLVSFQVCEKR
jgi:hypothetical protein